MKNKKITKLSIFTIISFLLIILSFGLFTKVKVNAQTPERDNLRNYLNDLILESSNLFNRFSGTQFMFHERYAGPIGFNPDYDKLMLPEAQVKSTPWYLLLEEVYKRKITTEQVNEQQAINIYDEIFFLDLNYNSNIVENNYQDGYFFIPFETRKTKLIGTYGANNFYKTFWDKTKPDYVEEIEFKNLFDGYKQSYQNRGGSDSRNIALARILGNDMYLSFSINDLPNAQVKSVTYSKTISGLKPKINISNDFKRFEIHLPFGLKRSDIIFTVSYNDGSDKLIKDVAIQLDYEKMMQAEADSIENKKGLFGAGISYSEGIKKRIDNLIERVDLISSSISNNEERVKLTKVKNKLTDYKNNFDERTQNLIDIHKDCYDLFNIENKLTVRNILKKEAEILNDSIEINNKNAIYSKVKYTEASLNNAKNYLTNIYNNSENLTLSQILLEIAKIKTAANNALLKINYVPLLNLINDVEDKKRNLLHNWYNQNGINAKKKLNEIKNSLNLIETGKPILITFDPKENATELINLLKKVDAYDQADKFDYDNPYDKINDPGIQDPNANKKYKIKFAYQDFNASKKIKYDYDNTLFKAIKNPVIYEKVNNIFYVYFEIDPIFDSNADAIFGIKSISNRRDLNKPAEVLESEKINFKTAAGLKEILIPRKLKMKLHKHDLENSNLKSCLLSIDFHHEILTESEIAYEDLKIVFDLSTIEEIQGSATLDSTIANKLLKEFVDNKVLFETNLKPALLSNLNLLHTQIKNHITKNDIDQSNFNLKVNDFKSKLDNAKKYVTLKLVIDEYELKFNNLDKSKYTQTSLNLYKEIIRNAKTALDNENISEFEMHTNKLKSFNSILIINNINYQEAMQELAKFKLEYNTLPDNVKENLINSYNILKAFFDNQNAPNQAKLNLAIESLKLEYLNVEKYLALKNLYDEKNSDYLFKKSTNNYTQTSLDEVYNILVKTKVILEKNEIVKFDNSILSLTNVDNLYILKSTNALQNGTYTVSVLLLHLSENKISHADDALINRAKLIAFNGNYKIYLRFKPLTRLNGSNEEKIGILKELKLLDLNKTIEIIKTETIDINGTSYEYPSEISFEINIDKFIYKVKTISIAFGMIDNHEYDARLFINIRDNKLGFDLNEKDKKDLIKYIYELQNINIHQELTNLKNIINNELLEAKNVLNDLNASLEDIKKRNDSLALLLLKIAKYNELKILIETSENQIKIDKKTNLYSLESISNRINSLNEVKRILIDFITNEYNLSNESKLSNLRTKINNNYLLSRYNLTNLNQLLQEAIDLNKLKKDQLLNNLINETNIYIGEATNKYTNKTPELFFNKLKERIDILKGNNPVPIPIPEDNNLLNSLYLKDILFNFSLNEKENKNLLLNDDELKKSVHYLNELLNNNIKDYHKFNELLNILNESKSDLKIRKNITIFKDESKTSISKLNNYLKDNEVLIEKKNNIYILIIKFKKGYVSNLEYNLNKALFTETNEYDEFRLNLNNYQNILKVSIRIKAMNKDKEVYLFIN